MPDILVIGCGNPLRRDDGLGRAAIDGLASRFKGDDIRFLSAHQLTPELASDVAQSRFVIFIDARCDCQPGTLRCETVDSSGTEAAVTHQYSPQSIAALASALYDVDPAMAIVSMGGEDFGHGEGLSDTVSGNLRNLVDCVAALISFARK